MSQENVEIVRRRFNAFVNAATTRLHCPERCEAESCYWSDARTPGPTVEAAVPRDSECFDIVRRFGGATRN